MLRTRITTDEDQKVTFIELFFDVVFVFAVTQIVVLLHSELTWPTVGRAVLLFWLVWWAWTQFTWALNSADTTHPAVDVSMLAATALAFLMAVVIPNAFDGAGAWFAAAYVLLRLLGLGVYTRVAWDDPAKRAALARFGFASAAGLAAVAAGGGASGNARLWWWGAAILLDLFAAGIGATAEGWDIRPEHFVERHGLFIIIALGESLLAAATGLTGVERTGQTVAVAVLAVAGTCGLWWTYFFRAKPALDRTFNERSGSARSVLARDVYSFLHFVVIFGIVLFAVTLEEAIEHPDASFPVGVSLALAAGLVLFLGGITGALWRAGHAVPVPRLAILGAMLVAVWAAHSASAGWSLLVVVVGTAAIAVAEQLQPILPRR